MCYRLALFIEGVKCETLNYVEKNVYCMLSEMIANTFVTYIGLAHATINILLLLILFLIASSEEWLVFGDQSKVLLLSLLYIMYAVF